MDCEQIEVDPDIVFRTESALNERTCDRVTVCLLQKAVDLMSQVPKLCNDMMNLGRLQGYEVGVDHLPRDLKPD